MPKPNKFDIPQQGSQKTRDRSGLQFDPGVKDKKSKKDAKI